MEVTRKASDDEITQAMMSGITFKGAKLKKATNETKNISKAVNLTDEEISLVKELIERLKYDKDALIDVKINNTEVLLLSIVLCKFVPQTIEN